MSELLERHRRVIPNWVGLYYDEPLELTSGSGSRVTDSSGRSYLDFFCGILTNMLGYDVPEVRQAVQQQLDSGIVHTSTLYLIRHQVELAEKLARLSGIENAKVFFTNSGTEANETALMLATVARKSNQVLALRNSYHGRSFGAVAITGNGAWKPSQLAPFNVHYLHGTDRQLPAFAGLDDAAYTAACVQDLRHVLSTATAGDVACLIAEPIQGVGGFTMPPDGLLGEYAAVLRERGVLYISDEVQTGWGRTGDHFWGIGAHGVTPDMITFAKGLGNGFAIGGVIARGDLMDGLPGNGISTFGGNPLSTAAANATLDYVLDHDLQHNAAQLGGMIIGGLRDVAAALPAVGQVRGKGLMFAIDMVDPATGAPSPALATRMLAETRERGLLIGKGGLYGHALRMAPPMNVSEADAKEGLGILADALRAVNEEASQVSDKKHISHWIGGQPWTGVADRQGDIYNPASGQVTGTVDFASAAVVGDAVAAAAKAFPGWRGVSLARRTAILFRFRELLVAHTGELAALISAEHGKVVSDAAGEIARGLEVVEFACGIPHLLKGGFSENVSTGVDAYSIRQPLGVVAGITPFNFPAMVPMWMFPLAIACGNTFVLKPSEKDPSASLLLARLWAEAGLPDGVFNVVQGDKEAVDALLTHPDVRAASFVGSTPIARYVYETGTRAGKRVQALGGAKNHMVVLPDADLDLAADAAVSAGFGSAGERCMAVSVLVAVGSIGDELVAKIKERVARLRVGPGDDERSEMGPLVTAVHRDKVATYLDSGVREGATLAVDGRVHPVIGGADAGFWLGPSVLDHVTPEMACYTDEIFGPVLSVVRAPGYDDAVRLVGENPYGNGTAIFTNDGGAARRFVFDVEAGMVGVNVPIPVPMAYYSFGGWKASLFGDTHVYGTEGVHFYTRGKAVTSRWLDPSHGGVSLGFPVNN